MAASEKPISRFDRVRQILNDAQGSHIPEYQGYRAFWQDIETFHSACLYGQTMIAPASDDQQETRASDDDNTCCGGGSAGKNPMAMAGSSANLSSGGGAAQSANLASTLPDTKAHCWPSGGQSGGGGKNRSRSERSGIIKGLRGQAPFDGSIFPPLLWDAAHPVSPKDITFIANWIDDGALAEDETETSDSAPLKSQAVVAGGVHAGHEDIDALVCGEMAHQATGRCLNESTDAMHGLHVRKEISSFTPTELERFRNAVACMNQYNRHWLDERSFDFWARIHTNSCQHGWEQFLPWHRLYLYFFEQTLQDYDSSIALPYWAWTDYADVNQSKDQKAYQDKGVIPEAYRCWLTDESYEHLKATELYSQSQLTSLKSIVDSKKTFNSGLRLLEAAQIEFKLEKDARSNELVWHDTVRAVYNECRRINPLWFPNRWPGLGKSSRSYPNPQNIDALLRINNWPRFGGGTAGSHFFGDLEQIHNTMHVFAGGRNPLFKEAAADAGVEYPDPQNPENPEYGWMSDNRTTAYDPIFWAHHTNVDRVWARWQDIHPHAQPRDLNANLAPWSLNVGDAMDIQQLGYEYMRDSYHYPTHQGRALTRFKGADVGVRQSVLDLHRHAEIRLHRVQRANLPNCSIRVFLNSPSCDANTPTDDNPNFVGELMTFHGSCYGGPQHCAPPLPRSRNNDLRPLHHHEPRNFHLDATDAVQRLCREGNQDLSVQLVVTGMDGQPIDNALFIDGVSLNFMD